VFERFSEHAGRAVSWAQNEAWLSGAERVETEHLLLGILRDDARGVSKISAGDAAAIRRSVEQRARKPQSPRPTKDLPLSHELKRAIAFGFAEADALQHKIIDTPHLLLGLLREDCTASKLLRKYGLDYDRYRAALRDEQLEQRSVGFAERPIERPAPWNEAPTPAAAPRLEPGIRALENLLDSTTEHLNAYSDSYGDQRLKRKSWTRKEAFGHLVDWAMAHQQWFASALAESKVTALGYPGEAEVAITYYADFSWAETVDLWVSLNRLLVHVLQRVPEERLGVPCRIGIADPITLAELVAGYIHYCEDIVGQILARL
jgi:Clp amino terminal domain, pathogenicity island component